MHENIHKLLRYYAEEPEGPEKEQEGLNCREKPGGSHKVHKGILKFETPG